MKDTEFSRRGILCVAAAGLLGACTAPGAGERTEGSSAGQNSDDGGATSDEGTGPVENPIEALITAAPYDAMTVTLVDDGLMQSWDITYFAGDSPILRYRLQGQWDGSAGQADGYQRLEEVRALDGAPSLQGEIVMPRSNWEFAFQLDVDGDKQFVPYHGTPTAYADGPSVPSIDGSVADIASLTAGETIPAQSFSLEQRVHARHPAKGETNLVKISTVTTWTADGKLAVTGIWEALEDVTMGSAYGPMLPFSRDVFDHVSTDTTDEVEVDSVAEAKAGGEPAAETVEIDGASAALIQSSDTGWKAGIRWIRADESLRAGANDDGYSDVFLQLREDGIAKVYPQVWDQGETVTAGATWEFAAEWIVTPSA